ncbi:FIST C-terminal domain-containing protein [Oscillospiraceae bacterium OttesenSCG-928-F05]|nr:FIST C-terminal domain-containing protein [Oscillospiraceae bacterium OttesenSCG-928-F05]
MRSCVVYTDQIDDTEAAAAELMEKALGAVALQKNSVGLLYCYSDAEVDDLVRDVRMKADFPIIGCTCIASMDNGGFHDIAAMLTVLTSDDHAFEVAVSEALDADNAEARITETYGALRQKLGEEPKLLYAIPPYILGIMLDVYAERLGTLAPGVPLVGGLPSYTGPGDSNCTFFEGEVYSDRLVLLGISGDVRPVFAVQNVAGSDVNRKRKVTKAVANTIFEVNGQPFVEYLQDVGLQVEQLVEGNTTVTFVSNPLLVEVPEGGNFVRTLHAIDSAAGSGTAIGRIPEGATVSVCALDGATIEGAAAEGMEAIKTRMAQNSGDGYAYTTVLAVSCIGRHLLLLPENHREAARLQATLPEGLTLSGFYSYGELGPQGTGRTQNFAHNESLILCAF